jgi:large subunit ribosomal protein L10
MAITRKQKEELVENIAAKIKGSRAMVFVDYRGLTVEDMTEIRRELRAKNVDLKVMKQNLFKIAAKNAGAKIDMDSLKNHPVGIAFGQDEVEPAKVIYEFSKKHESLEMIGGAIGGETIGMEQLKALALMPSREEMYAKIVGSLASPLRGLASVLQGNLRGLVSVLSQYQESKN